MLYDYQGNILLDEATHRFAENMTLSHVRDTSITNKFVEYTVLRIFRKRRDGTEQHPFVRFPTLSGGGAARLRITELASQEHWNIITNAGLGVGAEQPVDGVLIENGVVKNGDPATHHVGSQPLTIDANGNLGYAAADATGAALVSQGIVSACCGFCPIIVNGAATTIDTTIVCGYDSGNNPTNHFTQGHGRQIIGQYTNGDYGIVSCEGGITGFDGGWTLAHAQEICLGLGLVFAYCLDGGKSVGTYIDRKLYTHNTPLFNSSGARQIPSFLVFNGTSTFAIPTAD